MGQKVHPTAFRLGGVYTWSSRWFASKQQYRDALKQDHSIRKFLQKKFKDASVVKVDIERSANTLAINILTAKPGVIIGRGGQGVEALRKELLSTFLDPKTSLTININEEATPNLSSALIVQAIISDIERRIPFRRAMRQALSRLNKAGAEGAKIVVSGRLDGAEIARTEKLVTGKIPMHTLRANIDYSRGAAHTTYGAVGVKAWVYKGEIFAKSTSAEMPLRSSEEKPVSNQRRPRHRAQNSLR